MRYKEREIESELLRVYNDYARGYGFHIRKVLDMMETNQQAQKSNRRLGRIQIPLDGTDKPTTFAHTMMCSLIKSGKDLTLKIVAGPTGIILDIYPAG